MNAFCSHRLTLGPLSSLLPVHMCCQCFRFRNNTKGGPPGLLPKWRKGNAWVSEKYPVNHHRYKWNMARYVNESSEPSCCTWREGRMCGVDRHFHHSGLRQLFWLAPFYRQGNWLRKVIKRPRLPSFRLQSPTTCPA